jgi:iron complex outermembrane recepter protein
MMRRTGELPMLRYLLISISISLLLGKTSMLLAQHTDKLEEVTVTARPEGFQNIDHIAQALSVLNGSELREKVTNSIGETLSQELGVTASDFGQGASRPVIRGLSGARVKIMQDGIATLDVSTVSVDHQVTLEPGNSEQIEILRGPATLLYGSGAFGGLINVDTHRIPAELADEFSASLDARFHSASAGKSIGFKADGGSGSLALHLDTLIRDSSNYDAAKGEILNSAVESNDLNFGLSIIGKDAYLGASVGRYSSQYGIPLNLDEPDEKVSIDQDQDRFDLAGQLDNPLPGFKKGKIRFGYVDYEHTEFENPGEAGTQFFNNEWEGRVELRHQALGVWNGTMGLQYRNRRFNSVGNEAFVPRTKLDSIGLFILEDRDWHDWHIEIGGRYEWQETEPVSSNTLFPVNHDVYSVSFGAIWNFSRDYNFGLSSTRAQRAPAIEELFAGGPHLASGTFEEGDATLEEETSNNIDLSLRHSGKKWSWDANVFFNYIEDFIFQQAQDENGNGLADKVDIERMPGGELLLITFRQKNVLFYGIEAESNYEVFDNENGILSVRLWGDWVRAKMNHGGNLPRISPARIGSSIEFNRRQWHADVDLIHSFKQDRTSVLETVTGAYTLLNIGLGYNLSLNRVNLDLSLRATNLFDETARRHTSFLKDRAPLPGRAVTLGVSLGF